MGENVNVVCSTCIEECLADQEVISCELCSKSFHRECLGYNKTQFKAISALDEVKWFCKPCNSKAKDTLSMIKMVMTRMDLLEERNKVLASKNAALEKRVLKLEKSNEESKQPQVVNNTAIEQARSLDPVEHTVNIGTRKTVDLNKQIRSELREIKEIEDRKCKFLISNIPEEDTSDEQSMKKLVDIGVVNGDCEKETVKKILAKLELTENVEVIEAVRIPARRDPEKQTPRNVLVTTTNEKMKKSVLDHAKNLKKIEGWETSYITPDLTKQQREQAYHLRVEKRRRIEAGESNLIIRNGEIVVKNSHFRKEDGRDI